MDLSRRQAVKAFCLGIMNVMIPGNIAYFTTTKKTCKLPRQLNMANLSWMFLERTPELGGCISFYPCVYIDHYEEIPPPRQPTLDYLISDIYEFCFRPVQAYQNNQHKNCHHYLIEIMPGFTLFHFNWFRQYEQYLTVGQWYQGFGYIANCGDPSEHNSYIDAMAIKNIRLRGEIEQIWVDPVDWDVRKQLGQAQDVKQLKQGLRRVLHKSQEIKSTELAESYDSLIYCVRLI
jgi:hypothetical protein